MATRRVSSHTRNGHRVRSYNQGYRRGEMRAAAGGVGVSALMFVASTLRLVSAVVALVTVILVILAAVLFGSEGQRKRTRRVTVGTWRRARRKRRRPARASDWQRPWANDRTGVWRRVDGQWSKVR